MVFESHPISIKKFISFNVTIYQADASSGKSVTFSDAATVKALMDAFSAEVLGTAATQYRGAPDYLIDFQNGFAIGLYKDRAYCYVGTGVSRAGDRYVLAGSDNVLRWVGNDALELVKSLLPGAQNG